MTGPTPASGSAVVTEYAYDTWGRTVGTRVSGDTAWSCTNYDARGRITTQTAVGPSGVATLTTTTTYTSTVTGARVVTTGTAGAITVDADLVGRTTRYEDATGTVTTNTFEALTGRLTSTSTTPQGGAASVTGFSYDLDGKPTSVTVDGQTLATPAYTTE